MIKEYLRRRKERKDFEKKADEFLDKWGIEDESAIIIKRIEKQIHNLKNFDKRGFDDEFTFIKRIEEELYNLKRSIRMRDLLISLSLND